MLPLDTILAFVTAATLLALTPGPDNLFVLTQSALHGRMTGIFVTIGLCLGLIVHTSAVAFGVAVIFQTSMLAFTALKVLGAAYLLYLAFKAFRATPETLAAASGVKKPAWQMVARGIVMNVTNPKVAIFFLAFLPQFTDPARGSIALQMLMLGGLFMASAFVTFSLIAILAGSLSRWLRASPMGQVWLNRVAGLVFAGLALKLATAHR
ncbi:MAG: LysE family translocator [Hyphomicrobiales bacterium]